MNEECHGFEYEELKQASDDWNRTFDAIADLVFIQDKDFRIIKVNRACAEALKSRPEDIIGKKCYELFHKSDRPWPECPFEMTKRDQSSHTQEVIDPNIGIPLLVTASPIFDDNGKLIGSVHIAKDITERKQLEHELEISKKSFHAIITKSAEGVLVVDRAGMVHFINPSAEILLNRRAEELIGTIFGFPVIKDAATEIDILRKGGGRGIAEMRAIETRWHDKNAYLISLRDVTESVQLREELRRMSITDELTGLYNRRGFLILADQQLKIADRAKKEMLLVFSDLDGMKWINDNLGHKEGDRALVNIANILNETFRKMDIIARIGGDEFAVLVVENNRASADILNNRLQMKLDAANTKGRHKYTLSLSIGWTVYNPRSPRSLGELMIHADRLMYENKQSKQKILEP